MPGASGEEIVTNDSKAEIAEAVALRIPYLSQLKYLLDQPLDLQSMPKNWVLSFLTFRGAP